MGKFKYFHCVSVLVKLSVSGHKFTIVLPEWEPGLPQTAKMESFATIVNVFLLTIVAKHFMLDICKGLRCFLRL